MSAPTDHLQIYMDLADLIKERVNHIRDYYGATAPDASMQASQIANLESLLAGTIEWKPMTKLPMGVTRVWVTDSFTVALRAVHEMQGWEAWAYIRVPNPPAVLP